MLHGGALMSSLEQVHLDPGANHSSPQARVAHSSAPWRPQEPEAGHEFIGGLVGSLRILSTQHGGFHTLFVCLFLFCNSSLLLQHQPSQPALCDVP